MGRFDSLKENSFFKGTNNKKKNKNDKKIRDETIKEDNKEQKNKIYEKKEENIFPEYKEQDNKPKKQSEWIKIIKKTEKKQMSTTINVNDPKYWEGPIWKGPVYLKGNEIGEKWKKYIKDASKMGSTIVIPNRNTIWSRDNINWHNSYNETFSPEQLQEIEDYELQIEMGQLSARIMNLHEKRKEESERIYYETGEIDSFMWAKLENEKYEKYCEKLEKEWEESERLEKENEEIEEEEYLEEEYD
jgi:hypothetical protein